MQADIRKIREYKKKSTDSSTKSRIEDTCDNVLVETIIDLSKLNITGYSKKVSCIKEVDILSSECWKNSKAYLLITQKETQVKYYTRNNSSKEVLELVNLDSKRFGSEAEKIIKEIFKMGQRTSTQNDGTINGVKVEIKAARYWDAKDECVWQHLEADYDYEIAMFALLDFTGWNIWCIRKTLLMGELITKKIVTFQGKQGHWVKKSAILPYLTSIKSVEDLEIFAK